MRGGLQIEWHLGCIHSYRVPEQVEKLRKKRHLTVKSRHVPGPSRIEHDSVLLVVWSLM